ncbi:MAG: hypothetical protein GY727_06060 [Gammaproteobacteria bacterium]|nr:hypothetical protein [Gammaproteobacteria bacterium]MCP4091438.1 hypothetical protein [Gammaproteobacteria bacterium]MCP4929382.1 hypothetical protein [Gammaproteobacteria bacterium]
MNEADMEAALHQLELEQEQMMSQYICPHCKGEYNTLEDHECSAIGIVLTSPKRAQDDAKPAESLWLKGHTYE